MRIQLADPVRIVVARFLCPFCRRGHSSKPRATVHIGRCWYNPANGACKTCAHQPTCECEPAVGYRCPCSTGTCNAGVELRTPDGSWRVEALCPLWAPAVDPNTTSEVTT